MSKKLLGWVIVIAVIAILGIWMKNGYNAMVVAQENVENAWGQVQTSYQHRADLVPQLVGVVQGVAEQEQAVIVGAMEARAKATSVNIDPSNMTEEQLKNFQQVQGDLSQAMNRLMAAVERYPEIKSNANFSQLQSQLEGIANRITVARKAFNDEAKVYNTLIRKFPNNLVAMMFSFERKPYFEAEAGAEKAPEVKFDFNKKAN
ncbi:MAG: LemA family protein [Paludibacteraceae bacterium]|nr:LemA family protein [Paludibacteraceae bacterium]